MPAREPENFAAHGSAARRGTRRGWARLGWFIALWCAGVLTLTAIGLAIRFMLKM
jgi:hypothetical protein